MRKTVSEILRESASIYEDRSVNYGENYKEFGDKFFALLKGVEIKGVDDINRIGVLIQIFSKISRYMQNWDRGGHKDSLQDLITYTAMLQELDEEIAEKQLELDLPSQPKNKIRGVK